ncbi:hypothetical protein NLX62_06980, partial [Mycobacteriaceae bacterium Msp059]|nr:hypothetical protein [Mycobacteriaceae bacterium Msp059]
MVHGSRCPETAERLPLRYGLSVIAVGIGVGIAGASGHPVAWADPGSSGSSGQSSSHSSAGTGHGPKKPADRRGTRPGRTSPSSPKKTPTADTTSPASASSADDEDTSAVQSPTTSEPNSSAPQLESIADFVRGKLRAIKPAAPVRPGGTQLAKSDFSPPATAKRLAAITSSPLPGATPSRAQASAPALV